MSCCKSRQAERNWIAKLKTVELLDKISPLITKVLYVIFFFNSILIYITFVNQLLNNQFYQLLNYNCEEVQEHICSGRKKVIILLQILSHTHRLVTAIYHFHRIYLNTEPPMGIFIKSNNFCTAYFLMLKLQVIYSFNLITYYTKY